MQCSAVVLQLYCSCVAGVLQVCCSVGYGIMQCSALVLQVCCRCVAGVLQVCCRCVAGVLQCLYQQDSSRWATVASACEGLKSRQEVGLDHCASGTAFPGALVWVLVVYHRARTLCACLCVCVYVCVCVYMCACVYVLKMHTQTVIFGWWFRSLCVIYSVSWCFS